MVCVVLLMIVRVSRWPFLGILSRMHTLVLYVVKKLHTKCGELCSSRKNLQINSEPVCTKLHWHAHSVASLKFSNDGMWFVFDEVAHILNFDIACVTFTSQFVCCGALTLPKLPYLLNGKIWEALTFGHGIQFWLNKKSLSNYFLVLSLYIYTVP